jgi:hypothetical protein
MPIYVNNIGDTQSLPLMVNNPQDGEALIWSEELGAYVNAPGSTTPEQIQDTVAEMLEVDPLGSNVNLRLVSNYDDQTGKLSFNIVTDSTSISPGNGPQAVVIKENGAVRGTATALDFAGPAVSINNGVATVTGLLDSIAVSHSGTALGDVRAFNFEGFTTTVSGDVVTVALDQVYTLPTASATALGGIKIGQGLSIDANGVVSAAQQYVLPVANANTLGGVRIGTGLQVDSNGVISAAVSQPYSLPVASTGSLGGIKVDGTTVVIDANGVISAVSSVPAGGANQQLSNLSNVSINTDLIPNTNEAYDLGSATFKWRDLYLSGQTINLGDAVITSSNTVVELPLGSSVGGVTIGVPFIATATDIGGIKIGDGLISDLTGLTDVAPATKLSIGGLIVGDGLDVNSSGRVSVSPATNNNIGGIKVGSGLTVTGDGTLNVIPGLAIGDVQTYLTNNSYATTTYIDGQINNLVNGAPAVLNTLKELSDAINNDSGFAATVTTGLAGKLNLTGGTLTGALTLNADPTADLQAATKKYVDTAISSIPAPTTSLSDLTDVSLTSVTAGQVLGWNGTQWTATNNTGLKGDQGDVGPAGAAGLSVTSATISLTGRLLLTMSNGSIVDAGNVSGVASALVNQSGQLVLTKQDGTTINAGSVIGPKGDKGDTGLQGLQGLQGQQGLEGVSVQSASVNQFGRLLIVKSDNSTIDAGSVKGDKGDKGDTGAKGDKGDKGEAGAAGDSISSAVVNASGNLIVTLTSATEIDAGSVVGPQGPQGAQGPAGRSIANGGVVVDAGGNLQVTLTDGVVLNAGYVVGPQGSVGPKGDKGDKGDTGERGLVGPQGESYSVNGADGSVQIYGLASTTQTGYDFEVDLSNKALRLANARTVSLTGKVTGLASFDGSTNLSITTALSGVTTNDVGEGTNQYFTQARARSAISSAVDNNITSLISYDSATGTIKYRANTSYITEGSNLYFTNTRADARADARIAASSINALADVDTVSSAPTVGQVLTWTGSAWTPAAAAGGAGSGVTSVNAKTGTVTLNTDDVLEGVNNLYYTNTRFDQRLSSKTTDNLNEGTTNKYFSNTLARSAFSASNGINYNSSTGAFTLTANSDQITEGTSNLYFSNSKFDTRLGQSNLSQLSDVSNTTPATGQALTWNGTSWAPTTISTGSGGGGGSGSSSGIFRAAVQVEYDASGNLTSASVLSGGISAVIASATSTTATVTFTFTGSACPPLGVMVYGYQRSSNVYISRALASDFTTRTVAGGGSSGNPTAFSNFDSSTNTMTLSLTKALTGASAAVGQTTHSVVQFLLSSV